MTYLLERQKGITVAEIIIAVAILAILFSVMLPALGKMRENQTLQSAVSDVASLISRARAETLASIDSSSYGVHFEADRVIIFKGTIYTDGDPNNQETQIISPASISDINLSGGADVYFERLTGNPSISGTVTVSSPNFSKTITISGTGSVSIN
jgi:Tfp pilus assembly protein FimT